MPLCEDVGRPKVDPLIQILYRVAKMLVALLEKEYALKKKGST